MPWSFNGNSDTEDEDDGVSSSSDGKNSAENEGTAQETDGDMDMSTTTNTEEVTEQTSTDGGTATADGANSTTAAATSGYQLSDNVVEDVVRYSRSCIAKNEQQTILTTLGYLTGLMESPSHYVCGVLIGTSSSGKTHLQDKVEKIFPEDWLYQATTGSDQSIAYDDEWEESLIASLDELNKPSEKLIEILKSLHGDDEEFRRKVTTDWKNGEVKELVKSAKPYWFLYAQFSPDFELWNRLLKVPVHESKSKNEAVIRMQADHHEITFSDTDVVYDFEFTDGRNALLDHIKNLPRDAWVKLPAGEDEYDGFDVAEVCRPIFDAHRSESNRVSAMIFNLIRASALLNHENREKKMIHVPNKGTKDAIIAEPQDVANILACRDILMASTHELDRKKKAICTAIDARGGPSNRATIPEIVDYLRQGNAPVVNRTQIENNIKQLRENYLVERHKNSSEDDKNQYEFLGWKRLGTIDVNDKFQRHFNGVTEPMHGEDFIESVKKQNEELMPGASDFMGDTEVESNSDGQKTLMSQSVEKIELQPHQEAVREALHETVDGVLIEDMDDHEPSQYEITGVVDMGNRTQSPDVSGTIFDPSNEIWSNPTLNPKYVQDKNDAIEAVDDAMTALHQKGALKTEVHEMKDGEPVAMEFSIADDEEVEVVRQ